jgi:hypothetical protein
MGNNEEKAAFDYALVYRPIHIKPKGDLVQLGLR